MSQTSFVDAISNLDDWFPIAVLRKSPRSPDWVALVVNVHPDKLDTFSWDDPVWLYVHPDKYRPQAPRGRHYWFHIGKHNSEDAAWAALADMLCTQH